MTQLNASRYKRLTAPLTYGQSDGLYFDTTTSKLVMIVGNAVYTPSGQLLVGDGTDLVPVAVSGDAALSAGGALTLGAGSVTPSKLAKPRVRVITDVLLASGLTDGGAAVGTKNLAIAIPAGARVLAATIDTLVGFAGDTTATLKLGDGSTVARYSTGTPSIFATAAAGADMGVVSGTAWHTAAVANVVATVTSSADITPVLAGGGSCNVNVWFLEPV